MSYINIYIFRKSIFFIRKIILPQKGLEPSISASGGPRLTIRPLKHDLIINIRDIHLYILYNVCYTLLLSIRSVLVI